MTTDAVPGVCANPSGVVRTPRARRGSISMLLALLAATILAISGVQSAAAGPQASSVVPQVVQSTTPIEHISFGGTAWHITKCAGAIAWVAGTTVIPLGKVAKVRSLIKAAGGATRLATILVKAGSRAKKLDAIAKLGVGAGAEILGIQAIFDNC